MKVNNYRFVLTALMLLFFLLPCPSHSVVNEVTFFPNSAKVTETAKVPLTCSADDKCVASLTLPPLADPQSLIVSPTAGSRLKIDDLQVQSIERRDEVKIAELRKELAKLRQERKEQQARLQALDAQMQFWQMQTKAKTKSIAEADNLASAIGRNVRKASQEKFAAETETEKIDKRIKEIQENLNAAAGKKETAWQVILSISGPARGDVFFFYSYNLSGCGWLPLYRLEALPAENKIAFVWEAQIWQSSGEDWKQVQTTLATLQPTATIMPSDLPAWIIRPRPEVIYKPVRKEKAAAAPTDKNVSAAGEAFSMAAEEKTQTTYSLWSVGRKNLPAGSKQRLKIKEESWPAEFLFQARPSISQQAFVRASVKLDKPAEIPAGEALFLIDGAILGKREFSFAGQEGTFFFGNSPLVSVSTITLADKSGAKTFIQDKQTRLWQWQIEAKNAGQSGIKLRIEEPMPQARDERIRLTLKSAPQPTEKDHEKLVWFLELPAGQKKTIDHTIEVEAPRDMILDFGWRR